MTFPYIYAYLKTMLDPKHLYWLSEIVDLGSFSHAAQKLNVTQPTLSRAVQVIESQVGSRVLERKRYGVKPIGIGLRLAEAGRNIAAFRVDAENAVDLWRTGLHREVRLGVWANACRILHGWIFFMYAQRKNQIRHAGGFSHCFVVNRSIERG